MGGKRKIKGHRVMGVSKSTHKETTTAAGWGRKGAAKKKKVLFFITQYRGKCICDKVTNVNERYIQKDIDRNSNHNCLIAI